MKGPTQKPDLSYVPYEAMLAIAQAFEYGTIVNGHGKEDWRASPSSEPYLQALARHVALKVNKREDTDESGMDHLLPILANAVMALCIEGYEYEKPSKAPAWTKSPEYMGEF